MGSYRVEQRHVQYQGRIFHFVSYDGHPANERRGEQAMPPMWYLMGPGRRWPVMPQVIGQSEIEVEEALLGWLEDQGIGTTIPQPDPDPAIPRSERSFRADAPPPPPAQPDRIATPGPKPRPKPLDRRVG